MEFNGVPLDSVLRSCRGTSRNVNAPVLRENQVIYIYRTCTEDQPGKPCLDDFSIYNAPACEESLQRIGPLHDYPSSPRQKVRGAPAFFDGELRIYTGDASVVISPGAADPYRLAKALRSGPRALRMRLNDNTIGSNLDALTTVLAEPGVQSGPGYIGPGEPLPAPQPGAINGEPRC